jgi:putative SOS response-associated peptidase YedK
MCNLYSVTTSREAMLRLFRIGHNRAAAIAPKPAIFPGHSAPVVRLAGDGELELAALSWGFVLPQPGRAPRRVTNVRDDKARASPFWRESFERRRCLVPVTAFAEPNDGRAAGERATWHWFALKGDEPRPLFAFAGIWRRYKGAVKKDGPVIELDVYAFMTTTPNPLVATINHERMPVILADDAARDTWLRGEPDEAFALVRAHPAERMRIVQAGFAKEDLLDAAPDQPPRLL